MTKRAMETNFFLPMPVALVGATCADRPNFMAAGWITRVNGKPPCVAVGIHKEHLTSQGILEKQEFSVCFPDRSLIEKTDACGLVSGREADKSALFDLFYGELKYAPMISGCPVCLACRLHDSVPLPTHHLFVGEICGVYAEDRVLDAGRIDPKKADYLFLTMPDNHYWALGECLADAWKVGAGKV